MLAFIVLAIIEYAVVRKDLGDLGINFRAVENRYDMVSEMQRAAYWVRSLVLYSKDVYKMTDLELTLAKDDMKDSLNTIYQLQSEINL